MNRVVLMGVAVFLAVVGIGLLGAGADTALAGHGCCGCCGGCYGGCHGGCGGYGGGCCGCHGGGYGCGGCYGGCYGGHGHASYGYGQSGSYYAAAPVAPAPVAAPATVVAKRGFQRQPVYARRIAFRR